MSRLHPLARGSLSRLQPLDPVRREQQQQRAHGAAMLDAHSSINPYGGAYARYPAGSREDLRASYVRFLMAEDLARAGGGTRPPLTPEHVLLTPGSSAAIELICRAFLDPARGDQIAITSPAFPLYGHLATSLDIGILDVPLQGPDLDVLDLDAMISARPRVTFLCSPNNPTGRCLPRHQIRALLARASGIVVVDEAYIEFADEASAAALVTEFANLIVTRTFSKAWGLAGVRAGAVVADPSIIHTLGLVQLPFVFNRAAELALREKLTNPAPVRDAIAVLNATRRRLARGLAQLPVVKRVYPSDANFVLVEVAGADDVYQALIQQGILVAQTGWALPDTLRISVGTDADCVRVLASLEQMDARPAAPAQEDPSPMSKEIVIVKRDAIPSLTSVTVDGVVHELGILKEFRRDPVLARFVPETSRLSLSWVHLGPGEVLEPHVHPTESMIIMAHGEGVLRGRDGDARIDAGDVVVIPRGCSHGFVGAGAVGYWALSIQFEGLGLYEDAGNARVAFGSAEARTCHDRLMAANQAYRDRYTQNDIFKFVQSDAVDDKVARGRLLDSILVWSNYFQRVVLARSALTDDGRYSGLFKSHLDEEYDHNAALARDRGSELVEVWDPVLEATSSWFAWKMMTLDNLDKLVLVHLVLEAAATEWHRVAHPIMSRYRETNHFQTHDQVDHGHEGLGCELLETIDEATLRRLSAVQREGWDMMDAMCARMALLASQARA